MKKILSNLSILFLLSIVFTGCNSDPAALLTNDLGNDGAVMTRTSLADATHYYWYEGEKIGVIQSREYVNIIANDDFTKSQKFSTMTRKYNLQKVEDEIVSADSEVPQRLVKLRVKSDFSSISDFSAVIDEIKQDPQIKLVLPFFERGDAAPIGTSDIFHVKLKSEEDFAVLQEVAQSKDVVISGQIPYMPEWYTLSIENSSFANSLDASNYFYETGKFEEVDPAFMFNFSPSWTPNDPMFSQLWGLKNNSYPGIDINVTAAWDITRGAGATVAVLDQGIDPNHNDLMANFHSLSFDSQSGTSPSVFKGDSHGTHVAGTVAAVGNNGLQVVGVAPSSKIMRVSNDLRIRNTASAELASGISWAWQNGADVINNSWGDQGGAYYGTLQSAVLESALRNAMTQGRNGKGTVVVFAAGNYSPAIDYPANYHDDILVVGSIMNTGQRSSFSGYGAKLDVVAPGSGIISTLPNNNTGSNNGTSMAAPHVAGVAALIISNNPNLTRLEVVNAIEKGARKLSSRYTYTTTSGRPNGTWNNETGYGLVDAYASLTGSTGGCPTVYYTNRVINSNTTFSGCKVSMSNITLNSGTLTIRADETITIEGPFTAMSPFTLNK